MVVLNFVFVKDADVWIHWRDDGSCIILADNGRENTPNWEATEHAPDGSVNRQSKFNRYFPTPFSALKNMFTQPLELCVVKS